MICKKCGAENKDYFVYCKECSALLIEITSVQQSDLSNNSKTFVHNDAGEQNPRFQSVFESRRPSVSSFKENARRQAEDADASASVHESAAQRVSQSIYEAPPVYSAEEPKEHFSFGGGYQEVLKPRAAANEYRPTYENSPKNSVQEYELRQMSDGPYYDPKARHHALDPWELLDEPEKENQIELPPRPDFTYPYRSRESYSPRSERQGSSSSAYSARMSREALPHAREYDSTSRIDRSSERISNNRSAYSAPLPRNRGEYEEPYSQGRYAHSDSPYRSAPHREQESRHPAVYNDDDEIELEQELPIRSRSARSEPPRRRYDEEVYQERAQDREPRHREEDAYEKRSKLFSVLFWLVMAALIVTIIWYGVSFVSQKYGSVPEAFSAIFGIGAPKSEANKRKPPVIEETEYDGKPAHTLIVEGKDGEQAYFKDLDKKYPINGGSAKLKVVDLNWIPEEPAADQDTITVTPQVSIIDKDGVEIPLESPSFVVKVPSVQFTLSEPTLTNALTVDKAELTIAGTVAANSLTRIFINDDEITDTVDPQGGFSYLFTLPGHGDHVINVTAKLPRYKTITIPISVSYPRKDVALTLEEVPARTEDEQTTVKGTVEAGATVTVEGSLEGEVTLDKEAGTFLFVAKLDSYGRNDYTITATAEGVTTTKELLIIRTPNMEEYTGKATELDYAALKKSPDKYKGKVYRFEGKVKSILSTDQTTILLFNVGTEKSEKLLKLEYFGTTEMKEGSAYRVFGGMLGKDEEEGIPFLAAHFVYKP